MSRLHAHENTQKLLQENHSLAWDDSVALYLEDPAIGVFAKAEKSDSIFGLVEWHRAAARADYREILRHPAP